MKKRIVSKPTQKLLSMLIACVMLLVSIPMTVVGEGLPIGQIGADDNAQLVGTADTFYEDVSMRDEFSKHYVLESGERYAVIFPEAVHYEEDGEWKEVDNRLTYNSLTGKYVSANPKFTTAFAANASAAELVSITSGEYTVSWGISFSENSGGELMKLSAGSSVTNGNDTAERLSAAKAEQASLAKASASTNSAFDSEAAEEVYKNTVTDIGKAASSISYGGSTNSAVSLRYSVAHGKVEEDIILRSKSDFSSYTMTVNTGGLTVTAETDGSVIFKTADGETVFNIDAPWMKDSAYGFSKDIAVTVTQTGNTATITYTPGAEWLSSEDRVYPVLIDPTITSNEYSVSIIDTYALDGDWNFNYYDGDQSLLAGMSPVGEWFTFIKMQTFPSSVISSEYTVTSGELIIFAPEYYNNLLTLHKAASVWVGEEASSPPSTEECDSNVSISSDLTYGIYKYVFDLTGYFGEINNDYDGDYAYYWANHNHGFMISSTYAGTDDVTTMYSSNTQSINYRPMATFTYTVESGPSSNNYFTDEGVYNFKGLSGLFMGVDTTGTKLIRGTENNSSNQAFRIIYDNSSNSYKIKSMDSYGGNGKVIGFDSSLASNGVILGVKLFDDTSINNDNTEWLIEAIGSDNKFIIKSKFNPSFKLTVGGATDSSTNEFVTIYVSDDENTVAQKWDIMSGGIQMKPVDEIPTSSNDTLETGSILELNCAVTNLGADIVWTSSNPNVAIVKDGIIIGNSIGTTTITAREELSNLIIKTKTLILDVLPCQTMHYYVNNISNGNNMEPDLMNFINVIFTNGGDLENQEWLFTYVDGYYTIKNWMWGDYLTAPETNSDGANVVLDYYYLYPEDTQLWKITKLNNGNYKIQSKYHENSNLVLASNSNTQDSVVLKSFVYDDLDRSDEWDIFTLYDATLIATKDPEFGNIHLDSHASVLASLNTMGYTKNRVFEYTNASSCIEYMSTSKIVFTIGHGEKYRIILSDGELTINDLNLLPDNAFAVCQLVLYGACNTALGGEEDSSNLVNKTHAKGAVTVVGFEDQVGTKAMNIWAEAFFEALALGENVQEACQEAKEAVLFEYSVEEEEEEEEKDEYRGTDSYIIAGSKTQTFN